MNPLHDNPVTRRLLPTAQRTARRLPWARKASRAVRTSRRLQRISASGLFDQQWYETQTGRSFENPRLAIQHYLRTGRRKGLSPNPLIEPEWIDPTGWRTSSTDPFSLFLTRRYMYTAVPSAAFDINRWVADNPKSKSPVGGPLAHLLAADPRTPVPLLPFGSGSPRVALGDLLEHLRSAGRLWREQESLRQAPRRVHHFDTAAETRLLDGLRGRRPLTPADGRPLVSVIVPVRNRPGAVRRAIASVQAQTLDSWEIVAVDDGSTDDTRAVLTGMATFDERITVLSGRGAGVSAARNLGIASARGDLVAFLDSDNLWQPDYLRVMALSLQRSGSEAGYAATELRDQDGVVTYRAFDPGDAAFENLLIGNHIDLNVLVARRKLIDQVGGFDPGLRRAVDHDLALRLAEHGRLEYVPYLGCRYTDDDTDPDRISVKESPAWNYAVRARYWLDWDGARAAERVTGRLSLVIVCRDEARQTRRTIGAVLAASAADDDLEIVVVDSGSRRGQSMALAVTELADPRIKLIRTPVDMRRPAAADVGVIASTGDVVVLCQAGAILQPGWQSGFREALRDQRISVVQPVTTGADGVIRGAGVMFPERPGAATARYPAMPVPMLAGHPIEDARADGPEVDIPAAHGSVLAARAADLLRVEGLDPRLLAHWIEADLSLRLTADGGRCVLLTGLEAMQLRAEQVTEIPDERETEAPDADMFRLLWDGWTGLRSARLGEGAGLSVPHLRPVTTPGRNRLLTPVPVAVGRTVTEGPAAGLPALRWSLKIAAPPGPAGRRWGDWHFAQSLAEALRRLGQQVAVDVRTAHTRASACLDDVSLLLRGLDPAPQALPAQVNLIWLISHPELVTPAELAGHDRVCAAGATWARTMSGQTGINIEPLLQCTDATRFSPDAAPADTGAPVLFVGNSRGVPRDCVSFGLLAGADLHIYGGGWEPFVPKGIVRSTFVENDRLPALYASAGVVLNDHWPDMRESGFISNRVFDVLACAGRLATDDVAGLDDVLPGAARVWHSAGELAEMLGPVGLQSFPDRADRLAVAELVRTEHSFDARARRLLEIAVELR